MYRDPIGHRMKMLNNLMKRNMDLSFGHKPDKATLMHTWIIGFVKDREDHGIETFQKDIEEEFSINRSTTSEMLTLMCQKGMIERVPVDYDGRLKKIILTDQSSRFILNREKKLIEIHQELVEGISQKDLDFYLEITDRLIMNLKNKLEKG